MIKSNMKCAKQDVESDQRLDRVQKCYSRYMNPDFVARYFLGHSSHLVNFLRSFRMKHRCNNRYIVRSKFQIEMISLDLYGQTLHASTRFGSIPLDEN